MRIRSSSAESPGTYCEVLEVLCLCLYLVLPVCAACQTPGDSRGYQNMLEMSGLKYYIGYSVVVDVVVIVYMSILISSRSCPGQVPLKLPPKEDNGCT